jgi:hypothetical protein
MPMRLAIFVSILAALLVTAAGSAMAAAADSGGAPVLKVEPRFLERSLFARPYQTAVISGTCPEGSEIVVKVISPTRDFKLNKAGKSLGLVWVPSGHAEVTEIPVMYAVLSSAVISGILSPAEQERAGLCPDFRDVYQQAKIRFEKDPPPGQRAALHKEYVSGLVKIFKEGGLYQYREGAVKMDSRTFKVRLVYPANAPLGEYTIFCYLVQNGKARLFCRDTLLIKSSRVIDWLSYYAHAKPAIYGIFSAVVAVAVGLLVGIVLGRGTGH